MQLDWGAHAPSRAVLRALAEHDTAPCAEPFGESEDREPMGGAPLGTREGACAPQNELNRSGSVDTESVPLPSTV